MTLRAAALGLAAGAFLGCATSPPVTKIVAGRVIETRSVSPSAYEHAARSLVLETEGRMEEAVAELQRALLYDDEAPELHARLAELLLRLDRPDEAETTLKAGLAIEVTADGLAAQAHLRQARADMAGAVASLREAVLLVDFAQDPAGAESTYLELAAAEQGALDVDGARATLESLCRFAPSSIDARMQLAAVTWATGDLPATESRLREAVRQEPNQLDALMHLAWLYTATGRNGPAEAIFRDALDRSEGAPEIGAAFARFLLGIGRPEKAAELVDDLALPDPDDPEQAVARIELERSAGRPDRALAIGKRLREGDHGPEFKGRVTVAMGSLLAQQGKATEAVSLLTGIAKGGPWFLEARLRAAEILREEGKLAEALATLQNIDPGEGNGERADIDLTVALALIEDRQGKFADARRRLDGALKDRPAEARLIMTLAVIEEQRGAYKRALALAEQVLARDPTSVEALNFWGFVAADRNHQLDQARRRLVAALSLDPGSAAIIDSVGWVHFKQGDVTRAALFLEQAARLMPNDPEILLHAAALQMLRGQTQSATATLRKALSAKPDDRLRRRIEEELQRIETHKAAGK